MYSNMYGEFFYSFGKMISLRKVHLFTLDRILGRFYNHLMTGGVLCVVVTLLSFVCHIHHSIIDDRSNLHKTIIKEGSFIYA